MSKTEERYVVIGIILALLACVASWLALPQIQSLLGSPTAISQTPTVSPIAVPTLASAPTPIPANVPTPTVTPAPSPVPLTATPSCPPVSGVFAATWSQIKNGIGCAKGSVISVGIVEENFEHGRMLWRGEQMDHGQALALFGNGTWKLFQHEPFKEGSPEYPCADANTPAQSPPTPKRGFGSMWCDIPEIRNGLGNATDAERGRQGYMQEFDKGFMIQTDYGVIFVFHSNRVWEQR